MNGQQASMDMWFCPGTPVSSTNKTDRHNITEILLKVALSTITLTLTLFYWSTRTFVFRNNIRLCSAMCFVLLIYSGTSLNRIMLNHFWKTRSKIISSSHFLQVKCLLYKSNTRICRAISRGYQASVPLIDFSVHK